MPEQIVVVGSGAIATAIAEYYLNAGHYVVQVGRNPSAGEPVSVTDWTWPSVEQALEQLPDAPGRVIVATGALSMGDHAPEKRLEQLSAEGLNAMFAANTLVPAAVIQSLSRVMRRQSHLRLMILTARVGSISDNRLGGWYSYRASKAATNMLVRGTAIEWSRRFPRAAIAAYHPGTTDSALSAPFQGRLADGQLKSPDEAAECLYQTLENQVAAQTSGRFWNWDGSELPW